MRIDRKDKICETATILFNKKGYDKVSMREIARESGTTIGNLTYHFSKKEDIVIRIMSNLHEDYSIYFSIELSGLRLLEDLIHSFKKAEENEKKYPFYFKNLNDLVKTSEYFATLNYEFQKKLYNYYISCFIVLQEDGILNKELTLEIIHILAISFTTQISGWLIECLPHHNPHLRHTDVSKTLSTLLKPYITFTYQKDYEHIVDELL